MREVGCPLVAFFPQPLNVHVFLLLIEELIDLSEHLLNLFCGSFIKLLERKVIQ